MLLLSLTPPPTPPPFLRPPRRLGAGGPVHAGASHWSAAGGPRPPGPEAAQRGPLDGAAARLPLHRGEGGRRGGERGGAGGPDEGVR